ncbi:unnamed protein product, partial [marine sediment metagenome]
MTEMFKKIGQWIYLIWKMGSNITKVLEKQDKIEQRLNGIDETIKSPQYQVAELEKIKKNTDLLKEHYELIIKKAEAGSQEEQEKHREAIEKLKIL